MKFSVFSDIHYLPGYFISGDGEHLEFIQKRAEENGCDFIIHCGDMTHAAGEPQLDWYIKKYNDFHIPSYHCLGNHDGDSCPLDKVLKLYNMPDGHYYFDCKGVRMIVCDPNYYYEDGVYTHYDMGSHYKHPNTIDYMPPEQLEWLRETIDTAEGPCILISHQSFERQCDGVKNQEEVRKIINEANEKRPHSVLMCINGHHHRDNIRILDNVIYFELNSASFDYMRWPYDGYPKDLVEKYRQIPHTIIYNDPIHAVITVEGTTVTIEGMESSTFMGVGRKDTDNPICDRSGRPVVARVQSAKITLL